MRKIVLLVFAFFCFSGFTQNAPKSPVGTLRIDQKVCLKKSGYQLVLKAIVTDSRCPEGVSCIWAGEVTALVAVYKDAQFIEEKTLVFSAKNEQQNKQWLANYLPENKKNIKRVDVFPYPKEKSKTNPKKYLIKIDYSK